MLLITYYPGTPPGSACFLAGRYFQPGSALLLLCVIYGELFNSAACSDVILGLLLSGCDRVRLFKLRTPFPSSSRPSIPPPARASRLQPFVVRGRPARLYALSLAMLLSPPVVRRLARVFRGPCLGRAPETCEALFGTLLRLSYVLGLRAASGAHLLRKRVGCVCFPPVI